MMKRILLLMVIAASIFSCEKEKKENREKKIEKKNLLDFVVCLNKFSIRKLLRIKRGNYSLLKIK
jgi:hypothetical protein